MSTYLLLNWAILAVSLFNVVVMLWLGLTVLLNAEHYTGGVWLMGGGMLAGAAFFVSHTAIIGQEFTFNTDGLNFWWHIGWIPVIVIPAVWYVVILWYAGFWSTLTGQHPPLFFRHRPWLILMLGVVVVFVALLTLTRVLPDYEQMVAFNLSSGLMVGGFPLAFAALPVVMIACIVLSIDALQHPAPTTRLMGDVARQRSGPWLMRAAVMLLIVGLLVTAFIFLIVSRISVGGLRAVNFNAVALFDLLLSCLIAVAAFFIGQAIVSYEVFTGTALPRRGFFRQWRSMLLFAGVFALLVGGAIAVSLRPIYTLLGTVLLMIVLYALYSWRSFVERERLIKQLRPFVASQRLLTGLTGTDPADFGSQELFRTLCRDVLNTDRAALQPVGSLMPLIPLMRLDPAAPAPTLSTAPVLRDAPVRLSPVLTDGYEWAIPLRAERGQVGVLYIGGKRDGGLYTQEEIELAQAGGERVIDTLAGEHLARRLLELQRGRLAENRVTDMRTRRTLHDEVLPALHAAILQLSEVTGNDAAIRSLTEVHQQIARLIHQSQSAPVQVGGEVDLIRSLHRLIDDDFEGSFNAVTWETPDSLILSPLIGEVALGAAREVLRNASKHGRDEVAPRPLHLTIQIKRDEEGAWLTIQDDGIGFYAKPRDSDRGGNGLVLHSTLLTVIGGALSVDAPPEGGTRAVISLPPGQ